MPQRLIRVSCSDRPGLIATITAAIAERGMNVHQLDQFTDPDDLERTSAPVPGQQQGSFFFRGVVQAPEAADPAGIRELQDHLRSALPGASVQVRPWPEPLRVTVLASQTDHCLRQMLDRSRTGQLGGVVTQVVSNHDVHADLCAFHGVPFQHVPAEGLSREEHERAVLEAIGRDTDVIVLARYMRILSEQLLSAVPAPIINIHHSFLPSFIGANPYQRAHDRGVKMIGATAHYVTADLDEGPIIEQDVTRVDHSQSKEDLVRSGADVEAAVLYRAVRAHCEGRIFLNGDRTVILG